jgi:uncharacterized protein YciI
MNACCAVKGFRRSPTDEGNHWVKYVVFYESADNVASRVPAHYAAHRARWTEFQGRGALLMIGPFANAQHDGAMAIFTTREAAEEFARGDPFVINGVVRSWQIREWDEALAGP